MTYGPQPISHQERRQNALHIAAQLQRHYGSHLLALGVYGSLAREKDGPYSDIEMHCIVDGAGIDTSFEWSAGPWKAEVDVYSPEVILAAAAQVDGDWPITHGQFTRVWVLHDPTGLFPQLHAAATGQPESAFREAMCEVIVGEIYELVGKVRNAQNRQDFSSLPLYTLYTARHAACLSGLFHRHLYSSSSALFTEALALSDPPAGYTALCQAALQGDLADPGQNIELVEAYWQGVAAWAEQHGLATETTLASMLAGQS